jgi:hypothetical protein
VRTRRPPKFKAGDAVYSRKDGVCGDVVYGWRNEDDSYSYKVQVFDRRVDVAERYLEPAIGSKRTKKATPWDQEQV